MKFINKEGSIIEVEDANTFNIMSRYGFTEYKEPEVVKEVVKEVIEEVKPVAAKIENKIIPKKTAGRPKK